MKPEKQELLPFRQTAFEADFEESDGTLHALSAEKQAHLDTLMAKNNAGTLTETERGELQALVHEAEDITLANARLLAA